MIKLKASILEFDSSVYPISLQMDKSYIRELESSDKFFDYQDLEEFFNDIIESNKIKNIGVTIDYDDILSFRLDGINVYSYQNKRELKSDTNGIIYGHMIWVPFINGKEQNWDFKCSYGAIGSILL